MGKVDVVTSENHLANVIETLRENHDEAQKKRTCTAREAQRLVKPLTQTA